MKGKNGSTGEENLSFSVELHSRDHIKRISLPDGVGDRLMIEGSLGKLTKLELIEDILLKAKGVNGTLRIGITREELKKVLSETIHSVLIGYMSQTGNTKKVAEAIFNVIPGEKTMANLETLDNLDGYDVVFIGFPLNRTGPPQLVRRFLSEQCAGKKVALFITHAASSGSPLLPDWIKNCSEAVENAELLGVFDCQGEASKMVKESMVISDNPFIQRFAKIAHLSDGHPDVEDLQNGAKFATGIIEMLDERI